MGVKHHTELDVWKLADQIRVCAWQMTEPIAFDRHVWLRNQMRSAANSACANIAEGFARYQPREFARFLRISRGSLEEIGEHLRDPATRELVPAAEIATLQVLVSRALRASARLIAYLQQAKPPRHTPNENPEP